MTLEATTEIPFARSVSALRKAVGGWRGERQKIALVPTMGALHAGHLALVERAKGLAGKVVVSIFVNPTQFGPHEDFDKYPRDEAKDVGKLARQGKCDLIYTPQREEMYPNGFATAVRVAGVSEGLESATRPHFFQGVATVVSKLLLQCLPDVAVFGEKDYQQLLVIRCLVHDLNIPVEIVGAPTMRESDGLALSSRNAYLSAPERKIAGTLNKVLMEVATACAAGKPAQETAAAAIAKLLKLGFSAIDYLEVRDAETLQSVKLVSRPARVLAAVRIGTTRLIDNVPCIPPR